MHARVRIYNATHLQRYAQMPCMSAMCRQEDRLRLPTDGESQSIHLAAAARALAAIRRVATRAGADGASTRRRGRTYARSLYAYYACMVFVSCMHTMHSYYVCALFMVPVCALFMVPYICIHTSMHTYTFMHAARYDCTMQSCIIHTHACMYA